MTAQEAKNVIVGCVIPNFDKESLFGSYVIDALYMAIFALEKLNSVPSAQPERQKGKWIQKSKPIDWRYECSECGSRPPKAEWVSGRYLSRYCPYCGARMENDL